LWPLLIHRPPLQAEAKLKTKKPISSTTSFERNS
jgi:hypothetical protein